MVEGQQAKNEGTSREAYHRENNSHYMHVER